MKQQSWIVEGQPLVKRRMCVFETSNQEASCKYAMKSNKNLMKVVGFRISSILPYKPFIKYKNNSYSS